MTNKERFLAACRNEELDRPPVWIMRQAGRYLPEYMELRKKHSFAEMCRTPELAVEATLQPIRRFDFDAAIIFSDILFLLEEMGIELVYTDSGPKLSPLVKTPEDVERLQIPDVPEQLGFVGQAMRLLVEKLEGKTAAIGFSGAPFTLAHYLVSERSARDFAAVKVFAFRYPEAYKSMMDKITATVADYLVMQAEAGADAVQVFDSWAGELAPEDFEHLALPYVKTIVDRLRPLGKPVIYYVNGVAGIAEAVRESGAQVLGVDWRVRLSDLRNRLGDSVVFQGNADPALLAAPAAEIRRRVHAMIDETGGKGHIVNLGKGVTPDSPVEGVKAFVEAVRDWRKS